MSDTHVVAVVPVVGPVGCPADVTDRLVEVPESDLVASAVAVASAPDVRVVLVHDARRSGTPFEVVARVVESVLASGRPVVPVLPCTDTVKLTDESGVVSDTPDRRELRVVQSPIGYPAAMITSGAVVPGTVPVGALTLDLTIDGGLA